ARDDDRRLRPDRDQRGLRRADPRGWPRAGLRLGQGQCERRRDRARAPDRRVGRADRRDTAARAPPSPGSVRPRHAVPPRRRLPGGRLRAGLTLAAGGPRVAVYGAGAVGCSLGSRLAAARADVHLIARGAHLAALREKGLTLISPEGVTTTPVWATDDPSTI